MGRTELTPKERDRRLNIILEASKVIFLRKGYFNTTMSDIASESGISRRTIYLYFKNKDEISYDIVFNAFLQLKDNILKITETEKSGYETLLDIKIAYTEYYRTRFADLVFTMFFDFKINTKILEEAQIKECFSLLSDIVQIIEGCLIAGMKDGSIRTTISDTKRLSISALNIIHATMQKFAVRSEIIETVTDYTSEQLIDEMFDVFFQSIKA